MSDVGSGQPKVIVVDADGARRGRVVDHLRGARALAAAGARVLGAASLDEALGEGDRGAERRVLVVNHDALGDDERAALVRRGAALPQGTELVLLTSFARRDEYARLFAPCVFRNLMALDPSSTVALDDLAATAGKLLGDDPFGLARYFEGTEETRFVLRRASERRALLDEAESYLRRAAGSRASDRLAGLFSTVVDEFVTNAFYNAPIDATGARPYAHLARTEEAALDGDRQVVVTFCRDGRRVGLATEDPFGSLDAPVVLEYLAKCFRRAGDQVDAKRGGAGLGLYYAFDALSHFVVNLDPGRRTEMLGLMDLEPRAASRAKSFNVFRAAPLGSKRPL